MLPILMGNKIDRITLYEGNKEIWSLKGDFNKSLTIGMLVAGKIMINLLNNQKVQQGLSTTQLRIEAFANNKNIPLERLFDDRIKHLHTESYDNFRQNMGLVRVCQYLKPGYNIWLRDGPNVSLYLFQYPEFMQGIFTITQSFNVNYADIIVATPIFVSYYDSLLTSKYYLIDNHPLPFFPLTNETNDTSLEESHQLCNIILNSDLTRIPLDTRLARVRTHFQNRTFNSMTLDNQNKIMLEIINNNIGIREALDHRYPGFDSLSVEDKNNALKVMFERNEGIRERLNRDYGGFTNTYTLDQFMNDMAQILIYSDPSNDIEVADTYYGYHNGKGLLSGDQTIRPTTDRSPDAFVKQMVLTNAI